MKKLYLSNTQRKIAGVCGGVAEYFNVDVTAIRILFLVVLVFTGFVPGFIFYVLAVLVIPRNPVPAQDN